MKLYVVRHAHAGDRTRWEGDDRLRPLSDKGWRQAAAVADRLADGGVELLLSSPYVRCAETLRPLADRVGATVASDARLAEGSGALAGELVGELLAGGRPAVLSSHGDVIPLLLDRWAAAGVVFTHDPVWPKASTWVLTAADGRWVRADYEPPPAL